MLTLTYIEEMTYFIIYKGHNTIFTKDESKTIRASFVHFLHSSPSMGNID